MTLWRFKKRLQEPADTGQARKTNKKVKRSPPVAMEVKVLALEAYEAGLSAQEAGGIASLPSTAVAGAKRSLISRSTLVRIR